MIKEINLKKGLLRHFWGKSVSFTEGINVIYGPNGTGKTLLIDALAYFTFVQNKGWSKEVGFNEIGGCNLYNKFDIIEFLQSKYQNGECKLKWDGMPVFKTQGILPKEQSKWVASCIMCGVDNLEDISLEKLKKIHGDNMSNGEQANMYVENLLNLKVPDLTLLKSEGWRMEYKNVVADYVITLPRDGKPTILIDELDGVFDFDNLYKFWNISLPKLVKKYQVIIVTHNPFFIKEDRVNLIGKEYYDKSMNMIYS